MATSFDFGGLLSSALGGTSALDDLLTPEQRAAIRQQGALSAAAALLQAAGPSPTRTSLGQALGSAFAAGQTGLQKGQEAALTQMLTRQKLEEAKREAEANKRYLETLQGLKTPAGAMTPEQALAAPGMAVGPTVERAALVGQPVPAGMAAGRPAGLTDAQLSLLQTLPRAQGAQELLKLLTPKEQEIISEQPIKTKTGYVQRTKSGGFIQLPKDYEPAAKPKGEPQVRTELSTGKEVLVQEYDDGTYQTIQGFGPPRKLREVQAGGTVQLIDEATIPRGGMVIPKTLAPQVVGGAETGYYVIGGGGGGAHRVAAPGAAAPAAGGAPAAAPGAAPSAPSMAGATPVSGPVPIIPGTGSKAPEAFMKAARQLNDLTGQIADYKQVLGSTNWVLPKNIPIPFTESGISLPSGSDTAAVSSRYNALLMGVKNLYELGALTGPDMAIIERQITNPASWSGLLTSKNAMNEQVKVLESMLARAKTNLETSYKQKVPEAAAVAQNAPAAAAAPALREGATSTSSSGRPIIFRNGQWVYQ